MLSYDFNVSSQPDIYHKHQGRILFELVSHGGNLDLEKDFIIQCLDVLAEVEECSLLFGFYRDWSEQVQRTDHMVIYVLY